MEFKMDEVVIEEIEFLDGTDSLSHSLYGHFCGFGCTGIRGYICW